MIHSRLRPYFKLINNVRTPFIIAVLCGIVYGVSSGFGLPFMTKTVFPILFNSQPEENGFQYGLRKSDGEISMMTWKNGWYIESPGGAESESIKIAENRESPQLIASEKPDTGTLVFRKTDQDNWSDYQQNPSLLTSWLKNLNLEHWQLTLFAVGLVPLTFAVRGLSGYFNILLINYSGLKVLEEIRLRIFAKLQSVEISYFSTRSQGDLLSRLFNDTTQLQHSVVNVANDLIKQPITFLAAMGFLIYTSIQKSEIAFILFSLAVIPICVLPIRFAGKKLLKKALRMQIHTGRANALVQENLAGHKEIRSYNLEERENKRFVNVIRSLFKEQINIVKYSSFLSPTIEFISALGVSAAIYYAAGKGITLEDFTPLVMALYLSYEPIKKLGAIHNQVKKGLASLDRIEEILHEPEKIKDPSSPRSFPDQIQTIEFQNTSFSYASELKAVEEIDFRCNMGESIALIGPSGAGKSTLIHLLSRFYDPMSGSIRINDIDIKDFIVRDLREHISLVSQDTMLFNDTIRNNLLLGNPNASDKQLQLAVTQAQAKEFIDELPQGFETVIGDRGNNLSGGQKQRISIARALLKDAPIIILDEASSALDTENEKKVQLAINKVTQGKLAFIIAHRLSTVRNADKIVVLKKGRVEQIGTHDELMSKSKTYSDLVASQNIK